MAVVASATAVSRIDHKIGELKNLTLAAEREAVASGDDPSRIVSRIVAAHSSSMRDLASTLVDMLKLDRKRALFTPKEKNDAWMHYAQTRLREFLDWGWNRMPSLVDSFSQAPQHGVDAQNRLFDEFGLVCNGMVIDLRDQHTEARIERRDKLLQWIKYAGSAAIGAAGNALSSHWFGS